MYIPADTLESVFDILRLKFQSRLIGVRYDEKVKPERQKGDDCRREHIWNHHPVETDTAGQDSHNLRVGCHLGSKEDHRNEHEQRTEHVYEVRNEIHVIVKDDGLERSLLRHEVIDLLTDIEDDDDADDEQQRHKEGSHELLYYVQVYLSW